ncbi:TRAP transporter substrate-binding protein [Sinomicrobium sp.]
MRYPIFLFFVVLLTFSCKSDKDHKVLKLGHGLDVSHPVHKAMQFMADRLEEKSGGKLSVEIYPSQQLGSERELLELLQIGSLSMTKVSAGALENFVPSMRVFSLPFLFRDEEHRFAVFDSEIGKELLNASVPKRLKGLTFYDAGSRSFYTQTPVHTPDDLKGLKIRVMESQTAVDMMKSLGGAPTPIAWGELYTALQQGIVDGAENNLPSFYLSYHYEVCKYFIVDEHTSIPDVLMMSTTIWNQLDEQEKKWVTEAAQESAVYEKKLWKEASAYALEEIKKKGVEVIYPEKEVFRDKVKPMYEDFMQDLDMKRIIEGIQAINN